ncbi:hypothetical protein LCGC14_0460090 [marine sediment metagenome]|uniref:Uncharacterized protein n=1 Tax=marine sediment metagenome TaxID=412755 RepID=A0A0F9SKF6_9ZZZZ
MRTLKATRTLADNLWDALAICLSCLGIAIGIGALITASVALGEVSASPTDVGVGTIVQGAGATVQAFGTSTVLGLAALVNLLTNLLKLPFIRTLLIEHKKRWLIPIISMGLGVAAALLTSLVQGQPVGDAILAGLMAGGLAIGGNEAIKLRRRDKRQA